jgi:hypothetical protein
VTNARDERRADTDGRGGRIVWCAWLSVVVLAVVGLIDIFVDAFDVAAVAVCVALFLLSLAVWVYALGLAIVRSSRGDDIAVAGLFFLQDSAPASVRNRLLGAVGASVVIAAATAWANPFAVLVPMLPLGLTGTWGARYGRFPARRAGR